MSQTTTLLSELSSGERISAGTLAYLGQRARSRCYDFVIGRFQKSGLTKAELARKLGKGPDRVGHLLASPGNWTIDTMAELLAAISAEEFAPGGEKFEGRAHRNITQADLIARIGAQAPRPDFKGDETGSSIRALVLEVQ